MPTYEYRCPDGHDFEKFVRNISMASAELPCPVCGKIAERKIAAGAGLVFKGSGFYITDYGKDGKKDQRTNAAAAASSLAEKSASKSDGNASSEVSKSESAKTESSKGESSKGDSAKSDSPKSASSKSETPKPAPKADSAPAPKKTGSSDK
jgi:putative FmdB family regulatory protein